MALTGLFVALQATVLETPVAAQITPLDEEPDDQPGLGSIVGSPDPGPDPTDAGDRGGYAQLALALILFAGVAFIGIRVMLATRDHNGQSGEPL